MCFLVPYSHNLNERLYQAVLMEMLPETVLDTGVLGELPPIILNFAKGRVVTGIQWPRIEDELSLVKSLHIISRD